MQLKLIPTICFILLAIWSIKQLFDILNTNSEQVIINSDLPIPQGNTLLERPSIIAEQDHRFIKKRTKPMLGFKSFNSAKITLTGIENIRMIHKGQIDGANDNLSTFENFVLLMAA